MRSKDYNNICWTDHLTLDENSPSGLVWAKDRFAGIKMSAVAAKKGSQAGSVEYQSNGVPKNWSLRIDGAKFAIHRIIWCILYGSIDEKLVIDHLDGNPLNNLSCNLSLKTLKANTQNVKMNNKSGYTGVDLERVQRRDRIKFNWRASWYDNRKRIEKRYSVDEYGFELAKELAIEHRALQIKRLNEIGNNYTDRHISNIQAVPVVPQKQRYTS